MSLVDIRALKAGDILPTKSDYPVLTISRRDDICQVAVMHVSGYLWHGSYGTLAEVL